MKCQRLLNPNSAEEVPTLRRSVLCRRLGEATHATQPERPRSMTRSARLGSKRTPVSPMLDLQEPQSLEHTVWEGCGNSKTRRSTSLCSSSMLLCAIKASAFHRFDTRSGRTHGTRPPTGDRDRRAGRAWCAADMPHGATLHDVFTTGAIKLSHRLRKVAGKMELFDWRWLKKGRPNFNKDIQGTCRRKPIPWKFTGKEPSCLPLPAPTRTEEHRRCSALE